MTGMPQRKDVYYVLAIILTVVFFGVFVIPQIARILLIFGVATWLLILIVCVVIPIFAVATLWMIVLEIQQHFKDLELSDTEVEESQLVEKVFTKEDEKFIEEKMREQLEKFKFQDDDIFELHSDLILTYVNNRLKTDKTIPLVDISKMVEIPLDVVKDILLVLIADGLVDGMIKKDVLECSD